MHIEDEVIKIYFRYVPVSAALNDIPHHNCFPEDVFQEAMRCYLREYTETESALLYEYIKTKKPQKGYRGESWLNVFDAMEDLAEQFLVFRDNEVKCRYQEFQRWRGITRCLGEDLPVCAFLARQSIDCGREWDYFYWPEVLGHTNTQLNAILKKGISENHFHLFGSAPVFQLIWVKLMNCVSYPGYREGLDRVDRTRRMRLYPIGEYRQQASLNSLVLQAAFIRALLFVYLTASDNEWRDVREHAAPILDKLGSEQLILDVRMEIQIFVDMLVSTASRERYDAVDDYAQFGNEEEHDNFIFSGERYLIYRMFFERSVKKDFPEDLLQLFYAYLLIKAEVRAEFVQINDTIGFENFAVYQKRKKHFLFTDKDLRRMVQYAVGSCFRSGNMKMLEIRITPGENYLEDAKWIQKYDHIISDVMRIPKEKYFYVYHVSKQKDRYRPRSSTAVIPCRDDKLRRKVRTIGNGIMQLRELLPETGARVKGIDACSQEIGCRPEVFAVVFRRLQRHLSPFSEIYQVHQLKQTYHVGEDFLDIVDGLRAVDEAVFFLNMRNGDRLGHATVLGIVPEEWYTVKHHIIMMNQQDYLDNLVWLYHKLIEFEIEDCEQLKSFILKEFTDVFREVYAENMDLELLRKIYADTENLEMFFNIHTCYDAWQLRGDEPSLYRHGYFEMDAESWVQQCVVNENRSRMDLGHIRNNPAACFLYYCYHFEWKVRECGQRVRQIHVPKSYVDGVRCVQKAMQRMVGELGIGIETNPSSNVQISTIMDYKEHPIVNLYDKGIERSGHTDCPQLFVSINTDDKGVFNTSLENEYALMASALENERDEKGRPKYNKQAVYQWIDNIRIMGNQQVFYSNQS